MIKRYLIQMLCYMLLCTILSYINPSGENRKYIRFIMGIFMILILLRPIHGIFRTSFEDSILSLSDSMDVYLAGDGKVAVPGTKTFPYTYFGLGMREAIKKSVEALGCSVEEINVIENTGGVIQKVELWGEFTEEEKNDMISHISNVYSVSEDNIYVISKGKEWKN